MRLGPTLGFFAYSLRKNGLRTRYVSEVPEIADGDILNLPGKPPFTHGAPWRTSPAQVSQAVKNS
ncbi:hypothetical protein ACIBK9_33810 [Nonomuraea sp. NPDC050227]|uniref:hypothetical protein n=1 Tax=Nonomuraea sp. NPDC050227 TaxID=3364360 RepID=UPI0037AD987A